MPRGLEQGLGALLTLVILLDVFLTVLYARMGTGLVAPWVARLTWAVFRAASKPFGRWRGKVLSFCGPVILVLLLGVWAIGLALGAGLVIHPALGSGVKTSSGHTPTDFVTAFFAGGSSLAIVGAGDFSPGTSAYRLLYLFNSLVGVSVTSLTLTYLMQVYTALRARNALGFKVHLQSGETGDAAELLAGWVPEGELSGGYNNLSAMAEEMSSVKEAHHFYPVLFYFRFPAPYYSVSRFTLVTLDAVSLLRSALDDEKAGWMKESAAVEQLGRAALILATSLGKGFVPGGVSEETEPDATEKERWRRRYAAAVRRLRQAGAPVTDDERAGAETYLALRARWYPHVATLAPAGGYSPGDVDPAGFDPEASDRRPDFRGRRAG
ncbi:MAG TPA: hypothetical protein VFQ39_14990 [Longimicrobium sp.]|nr:hypothetical protein [Longimicrobium sp.]